MVQQKDILPFGRFKYTQPYSGSCDGMRYNIVHKKPAEDEEDLIYVDVWPEPLCYDKVDESLIIKTTFPYGEDGYNAIIPYLNDVYEKNRDMWPKR